MALRATAERSLRALRGFPELGLDAVADLEVLERLCGGLKLVNRTAGLPHGHLALGLIHLDDLALDLLRGLHLALGITAGLALRQRRSGPQQESHCQSCRHPYPYAHGDPLISCRCHRWPRPRRPLPYR